MKASIRLIGPDYARIQPGRISLGRFCREAAPLGVRKRFPHWRGWAQPLLPDCEGLHPRCEGGLHGPAGAPSLRFQVDGQHVTIIATGHRPVTLPAPALSLMATVLLSALAKAKALVDQFRVALGKAMAHGDRAIRGAALQVQRLLRHGGPGLTPGLLRRVWEAVPAPFGRACMAVAARTRTNPGRVRYILNFYAEWWKMRTASSPHWVKGLETMLGLSTPELIRVSNANKWFHHKRRRRGPDKWWAPKRRRSGRRTGVVSPGHPIR